MLILSHSLFWFITHLLPQWNWKGMKFVFWITCFASVSVRFGSKESKMGRPKELGGEEMKTNPPDFENCQLGLSAPSFDAVISCHKLTNKMFGLPWNGSELSRMHVCGTKTNFLYQNIWEATNPWQEWRNLNESERSMQGLDCKDEVLKF